MKKLISTLAATMMAATSLASTVASAINVPVLNKYSLSTRTIENDIVVDDITVPAGSLAVTVNISNNTGFSSSSTNITLGDACVPIADENGILAVESGNVIGNSCICGVTNGELITVATASGEDNLCDGDMFTFYVSSNTSSGVETIEIVNTASEDISTTMRKAAASVTANSGYYKVGDIDNDGYVDSTDASFVLSAISINNKDKISIAAANANLSYYFPNRPNMVCAQAANPICSAYDVNENEYIDDDELRAGLSRGYISEDDAEDILKYYTFASTGQLAKYDAQSEGFCGRTLHT